MILISVAKIAYATTQARKGQFIYDVLPNQQFVIESRFAKNIDGRQMLPSADFVVEIARGQSLQLIRSKPDHG